MNGKEDKKEVFAQKSTQLSTLSCGAWELCSKVVKIRIRTQ